MSRKGFKPAGVPVLFIAGSGNSLNGEVRPGDEPGTGGGEYVSVGPFYVEDYDDTFEVFFNNQGTDDDGDDSYYIFYEGEYVDIGWGGDWAN